MKRGLALLLTLPLFAASATTPVASDPELARIQAEAANANRQLATLERQAAEAEGEAERLKAQQAVAAAAIEDSEARISAADATLRRVEAAVALADARLAAQRAPLASLVAGLVQMGRQPPLLALADGGSVEQMVRVRGLLDATMPEIERRSASLRADVTRSRALAASARSAREALAADRRTLAERQQRFAALEVEASRRAASLTGDAVGAGDRVLAGGEAIDAASNESQQRRLARATAAALLPLGMAPPRPTPGDSKATSPAPAYSLPVGGDAIDGLGSVSRSGIVSRGLQLTAPRGTEVRAPADGRILFAAPYRGQDGLMIIDHGRGWTSLLLNVSSNLQRGATVRRGDAIGRALGPVGVELRQDGRTVSPAFIAASSVPLSNSGNSR
ncbi:peptidoglycan DD-metalloendopeptidase family protein [Sphingomonas sp. LY29]|uniref:murein hydrolase activator EnvC family protein n=1 Tax=Sphingomonas sp. LY29 TaxID=3095341 RepID=UPI002D77EF9A|nr:peptidoglycan DD-metalloendopeptidase family protein [Sphingomonas sp. LY29]WRP25246.1 peptidoglycan DD-metalloendopeptidase family protein [Sphingomonas sp. LY29]